MNQTPSNNDTATKNIMASANSSYQAKNKAVPISIAAGDQQTNSRLSNLTPSGQPQNQINFYKRDNDSAMDDVDIRESEAIPNEQRQINQAVTKNRSNSTKTKAQAEAEAQKQINKLPESNPISNIQSIQGKYSKQNSFMTNQSLNTSVNNTNVSYQPAYEAVQNSFINTQTQPIPQKKPDTLVNPEVNLKNEIGQQPSTQFQAQFNHQQPQPQAQQQTQQTNPQQPQYFTQYLNIYNTINTNSITTTGD